MYLDSITFKHPNANPERNIALYREVKKLTENKKMEINEAIDKIVKAEKYFDDKKKPIKSTNAYRIYNAVCKKVKKAGVISQ